MGRIVSQVEVVSFFSEGTRLQFSGLVDTGATYLTLPMAWREQLGKVPKQEEVEMQTATGSMVAGILCGPYEVKLDQFRSISTEILFTEIEPEEDGTYEPLIGYIPLEQSCVAVDMLGHRLIKLKYFDLK